jgi:hypothetical protein
LEKVGTADNPADVLTKFVSSELMAKHTRFMGYRFPEPCASLEVLRHSLRRYNKHAALADQQRQVLEQSFRDGLAKLNPWGGNGIYPSMGAYSDSSVPVAILALINPR